MTIIGEILTLALPACVSSFLNIGQSTINLIFIGQLNSADQLAAVGMGTMVLNMIGFGPYLGLNSGLETLTSQAIGAQNIQLAGVYL